MLFAELVEGIKKDIKYFMMFVGTFLERRHFRVRQNEAYRAIYEFTVDLCDLGTVEKLQ